jgi:cytidylate kinase
MLSELAAQPLWVLVWLAVWFVGVLAGALGVMLAAELASRRGRALRRENADLRAEVERLRAPTAPPVEVPPP